MYKEEKQVAALGCSGIVLMFALIALIPFAGCDSTYSEGYRDGTIQKFSHKGIFVKSWEGELATAGFRVKGESTSNTFEFSVDDSAIISELESLPAETMVRLHYRQVVLNAAMWHSTPYRAVKLERIGDKK